MPSPSDILNDPNFHAMPLGERLKVMQTVDPNFAGLSPKDQGTVIATAQQKITPSSQAPPPPQDAGFWSTLGNDVASIPSAIGQAVMHPVDTLNSMGAAQHDQFQQGRDMMAQPGIANKIGAAGHLAAGALPIVGPMAAKTGDELGSGQYGQAAAHAAELLGPPAMQGADAAVDGAISSGISKAAKSVVNARTPNPDLTFQNAITAHPADTNFAQKVPDIRASIKRGAQITGTPVTNPKSAVEAAQAAQDEIIDALADYKTNARRAGATMPVEQVKAAQRAAIPAGLEDSDPEEYASLRNAIDNQFPNKTDLTVDDVFNQAKLNNSRLQAFYSGKEAAQNAKLMTNAGDTGVLKAAGDAYRSWIKDNLGQDAADLNAKWGDLNGAKHYLQSKINPSIREQPVTPLEGVLDKAGVELGSTNPIHGVVKGVGKKIIGRPNGTDALLKSAFDNTQAAAPPLRPGIIPARLAAPPDQSYVRSVPAQFGEQKALPPPTPAIEEQPSFVRGVPAQTGFRVGFSQKALPPATSMPRGQRTLGSQHGDILNDPLDLHQYIDVNQ